MASFLNCVVVQGTFCTCIISGAAHFLPLHQFKYLISLHYLEKCHLIGSEQFVSSA